jgi:hypothetical protein
MLPSKPSGNCFVNWTATSKGLAALCILPWLAAPALAQLVSNAHEKPPRVELDTILPANLMQSGVHRVEDNVRVKGTLFEFTLDSDLGRYDALSIPMALLRIHEIRTLAQAMDAFQRDNLQLAAALRNVVYTGNNSTVDILTSPLDSGGGVTRNYQNNNVGQAVKDLSKGSNRGAQGPGGPSGAGGAENMYESWLPSDPILASHKRAIASHLDLDIYSSNTRVQGFLNLLARARGGGNRNAGKVQVAIPNKPEIAVDGGKIQFAVRTAMARKTVRELYIQNETALQGMGIDPDLYHAFLSHRAFSPRHKTEITAYLVFMDGVANRGALLRAALRADDEVSALGYARMARMLAYYHEHTERLTGLVSGGNVLMATTTGNNMALVLPFDLVWWSGDTDRVFSSLAKFADQNKFAARELLLVGITTDTTRMQLERRKFVVREKFLFRP